MGEPKNPHFYDCKIYGRVPAPQNQYYLSLETTGYFGKYKKPQKHFQNYYFENVQNVKMKKHENDGNDGHRTIPTIRLINS